MVSVVHLCFLFCSISVFLFLFPFCAFYDAYVSHGFYDDFYHVFAMSVMIFIVFFIKSLSCFYHFSHVSYRVAIILHIFLFCQAFYPVFNGCV